MLKKRFSIVHYPQEQITMDDSLVLYKGRLVYIKTKRAKFGIKLYELANAEGVMLDILIYKANLEPDLVQQPGNNWLQTERNPLTFLQPYLDRGHSFSIGNFYTTPRFAACYRGYQRLWYCKIKKKRIP